MKFRALLVGLVALAVPVVAATFGFGGAGCGSSSSTGGLTGSESGYTVPEEISAVPTLSDASTSLSPVTSLKSAIKALVKAATDANTDYSNTVTKLFIEEKTLEQFDILETIFDAMNQTNYTSEIGNGPYLTKVAWQEQKTQGDVQVDRKKIEEWIVQSDWINAAGDVVTDQTSAFALRVRAWIEEQGDSGKKQNVKAEFKITSAPTRNADGSYADYGEWTGNVKFGEGSNDYFAASSSIENGEDIIMIHEKFVESSQGVSGVTIDDKTMEMKAIMHRATTTGYGKVSFPDYEALFGPDATGAAATIPIKTVVYAYDANHLAVKPGDEETQFKDRNAFYEMTHRYGVFNKDSGKNIMKSKSFGFPIKYTAADGSPSNAYYGAWQGRHQIWTQNFGGSIAQGTTVTRDDIPPDQPAQTYLVGPTYNGVLAKREYVAATLNDVLNIPVEIWISDSFNLVYGECDGGHAGNEWCQCKDFDFGSGQCVGGQLVTFDLNQLVVGANDTKKNVFINGWNQVLNDNQNFVYDPINQTFYVATETQTQYGPRFVSNGIAINTANVSTLWANTNGSIYVEYKGAVDGWVEKELASFDTMNWQPTFNDAGDRPYTLPEGRELYINMQGANYVVTRTGDSYSVQLELQTVANPSNASTFAPADTTFINRWDSGGANSTYEFGTDPTVPAKYMKLVYKTIGDNDKDAAGNPTATAGDVVTDSIWGLSATINGTETFFNWEYSSEEGGWGSITYLVNADGTYKYLDDPIRFNPITATNGAGESKTLSLQFDGWMQGLPDMFNELSKSDWIMTEAISNKIINLAAGTEAVDASTGIAYLIKPLEVGMFLAQIADPGDLSLTGADAIDLSGAPEFADHGMGAKPVCTAAKYSEGSCTADLVNEVCTVDSGCTAQ